MKPAARIALASLALCLLGWSAAAREPPNAARGPSPSPPPPPPAQPNNAGPQNGGNALPGDDVPRSNILATFYSEPGFRGARITVSRATPDLASVNFSHVARSARVTGDWQVCDQPNYRGRCETINGFVDDLGEFGLSGRVASARPGVFASPRPEPPRVTAPPPPLPDTEVERVDGRTVVLFPSPTIAGRPLSPATRVTANAFCRRQGLGPAVYFDVSLRDPERRGARSPAILSDIVCRRP